MVQDFVPATGPIFIFTQQFGTLLLKFSIVVELLRIVRIQSIFKTPRQFVFLSVESFYETSTFVTEF